MKRRSSVPVNSGTVRRSIRLAAALVLVGSVAVGCAGDDEIDAAAGNPAVTTAPDRSSVGSEGSGTVESALPKVRVRNVVSGELVDLSTLLPGDKPLLIWFWAPY